MAAVTSFCEAPLSISCCSAVAAFTIAPYWAPAGSSVESCSCAAAKFANDPGSHMAGGLDKARRTGITKPIPGEIPRNRLTNSR